MDGGPSARAMRLCNEFGRCGPWHTWCNPSSDDGNSSELCRCEERSDEAIHPWAAKTGLPRYARNDECRGSAVITDLWLNSVPTAANGGLALCTTTEKRGGPIVARSLWRSTV